MISRHITITKLDTAGKPVLSYPGEVEYQDGEVIVARCTWTDTKPFELGPFSLEPGDIFVEHYYPREWFNIFEIHDKLSTLKGWYCNVTRPVTVSPDEIRWWDLALDLLILPDGRQILLDEEEFEALRPSVALRGHVTGALSTLRCWLRQGHPPFNPLREHTSGSRSS